MRVFVLDDDLRKSAEYYCDKDLERTMKAVAQLLASTYYYSAEAIYAPYKLIKGSSEWMLWLSESVDNWLWLCDCGIKLYDEYKYRNKNRVHRSGELVLFMVNKKPKLPSIGLTAPPLPTIADCITVYKTYLSDESVWTGRESPSWAKEKEIE